MGYCESEKHKGPGTWGGSHCPVGSSSRNPPTFPPTGRMRESLRKLPPGREQWGGTAATGELCPDSSPLCYKRPDRSRKTVCIRMREVGMVEDRFINIEGDQTMLAHIDMVICILVCPGPLIFIPVALT